MKHIEARQRIENGEDREKIHDQFIQDKINRINYDRIAHADIRKKVEAKYTRLKAELDWCYYIFWQYGESCPFQKHDVLATKEDSFALYTELCNNVDSMMSIAVYDQNEKDGNPYPKLKTRMESTNNAIISEIDHKRNMITKALIDVS
jgi:hypothetical protein